MTLEETLAKLAQSRRELLQTLEGLTEQQMTQMQVEGVWTIKDVLGHVASWEGTCLMPLRRYAEGGPFEVEVIEDYQAWNDEEAARKREVPLEPILDELAATRQELVTTVKRLPVERQVQVVPFPWGEEGTMTEMLIELHYHEMEHVHGVQQGRGS